MHIGFHHSPETIAKMKEAAGHRKPHSIDSRKRQAASLKKTLSNPENHPMYGKKHTPESREKMRLAHLGKWVGENSPNFGLIRSAETRRKMSLAPHPRGKDHPRWGCTHTPEVRERLRKANLGKKASQETREKMRLFPHGFKSGSEHPLWGKHLSAETKEKIRLAHLGLPVSEETRKKLSLAKTGYKYPQEALEKIREARSKRILSPEARENISRGQRGKRLSPEAIENIRRASTGRRHTEATKEVMRQSHLGEKNLMWNGGISRCERGYISILSPTHPYCTKSGRVREHRLIAESVLKRFLNPTECVHHINKITNDNRPENLMVFKSYNAHTTFHKRGKTAKPGDIIFDGRELKH